MDEDETAPLLRSITIEEQLRTCANPKVDFDPNGDPDNPMDWSKRYKSFIVFLLGIMAFIVTFTVNSITPVAERIVFDLEGKESKSSAILLISIWELGEAAGPLFIAPLSEVYGRYPVLNVANVIFIIGISLGAMSQTAHFLIFTRFLTGFAVFSNVLNPAIIGDIYPSEERGSGMSLIMLAPLLGGAVGPALGGIIADSLGWRYILWLCAALAIICEIIFFTLLRETYKVPILRRRAAKLREETKDESMKCAWEADASEATWIALRTSVSRPLAVMVDSSVLQIIAFYGGLMFTWFYVMATTLPGLLSKYYGLSPSVIGFSFLSFSIGASCGIVLCNRYLDSIYVNLGKSHGGVALPEFRLPFMIGGAALMPFVVVLYGWAPYAHWPVYILLLAVALLGFTMLMIFVPLTAYVVDAFGLYSASAMTFTLLARCLCGTLLPLGIPPLTDAFGLGPGFLLLGAVCLVLAPLPAIVMRYGSRWRQNSTYTRT